MIIKLQRPLASNETDPPWLAYNRTRKVHQLLPRAKLDQVTLLAMGDDAKAYFEATLVGDRLVFGRRVLDRQW